MITVLGVWEPTWMEPRVERRVWKQTLDAFGVDRWAMIGADEVNWSIPTQFYAWEDALAAYSGKKTFLVAPGRTDSIDVINYDHPDDAVYVFGNTPDNLVRYVSSDDDVVSIHTDTPATLFGHCTLPIILYDRMVKRVGR